MKWLPKNLCKKLSVINGIGVCSLRDFVCSCWLCEFKEQCGKKVFDKCQVKLKDFKIISNVNDFYDIAVKKLDEKIESLLDGCDEAKIAGGMLFFREKEILHCFY
jgi:hypothetical protein